MLDLAQRPHGPGCKPTQMQYQMVDDSASVNAGEQITDSPANLPVTQEAQFRVVNQRLDVLSKEFEKLSKPPTFRIADVVSLLVIVIGLAATAFTALGLS